MIISNYNRRHALGVLLGMAAFPTFARASSIIAVDPQPFFASLKRTVDTLRMLGEPLPEKVSIELLKLSRLATAQAVFDAQTLLSTFTLLNVTLGSENYGQPEAGALRPLLIEQGWRTFLVRVINPRGVTSPMQYSFDMPVLGDIEAASAGHVSHERQSMPNAAGAVDEVARARLAIASFDGSPMAPTLSGTAVEYRLAQVIAYGAGEFSTGVTVAALPGSGYVWAPSQKTQLTFEAVATRDRHLTIKDFDGKGQTASVTIHDRFDRLYPDKKGRLEPDMFFQDQVYRSDGETLRLPDGKFTLTVTRGPEYVSETFSFDLGGDTLSLPRIDLKRWVNPAAKGWYSGDVHIHASGCAHYNDPSVGVGPETMLRHVRGEGLWIGEVLTWGPGWEIQKRNFSNHIAVVGEDLADPGLQHAHQTSLIVHEPDHQESSIKYDVEVSGFPSSATGHLVLMGLKDQNYPGSARPQDWPSWSLPILKWAKSQGALTGFAHCGLGLADLGGALPSYQVPSFDSIGANEYLVDVAHDAIDFLAGGDTIPAAELNLWYHALNCGFRTILVGETDWPCMSDAYVGAARTYVALNDAPQGELGYRSWLAGLSAGKVYMGDGRAHIFDFEVNGKGAGEELQMLRPGMVKVKASLAALLGESAPPGFEDILERPSWLQPRWHIERCRISGTKKVNAELVVNGQVVATNEILADGTMQEFSHSIRVEKSCWIAVRIFPSMHVQPVFISVGSKPIRASKKSAQWCIDSLVHLQDTQLPQILESEREAARAAYGFAIDRFKEIMSQCTVT